MLSNSICSELCIFHIHILLENASINNPLVRLCVLLATSRFQKLQSFANMATIGFNVSNLFIHGYLFWLLGRKVRLFSKFRNHHHCRSFSTLQKSRFPSSFSGFVWEVVEEVFPSEPFQWCSPLNQNTSVRPILSEDSRQDEYADRWTEKLRPIQNSNWSVSICKVLLRAAHIRTKLMY